MRVGLLLGSFDPPHIGHVYIASEALNQGMDEVWVIPCWSNPQKSNQTSIEHRLVMCYHTFIDMSNVYVMDMDKEIKSQTTYEFLQKLPKDSNIEYWILAGSDINIQTWYKGDEILNSFKVLTINRPDQTVVNTLGIRCSSSVLRSIVHTQRTEPFLKYEVINYIKTNGLYK